MGDILPEFPADLKPVAVWAYFDVVAFWLLDPIDQKEIDWLRAHSGKKPRVNNRRARFDGRFRQRIELYQPDDEALRWIAGRKDAFINKIEVTLDFIFATLADLELAKQLFHWHLTRRYHSRRQQIKIVKAGPDGKPIRVYSIIDGVTRYDGQKQHANKIAFYPEDHSRHTGELHCLHLDWRAYNRRAVEAIGIKTGRNLPAFDHRAFWMQRLRLFKVDLELLGRIDDNRRNGKRRRTAHINRFGNNVDTHVGRKLVQAFGSVQGLLDRCRGLRLERALIAIPIEPWLPNKTTKIELGTLLGRLRRRVNGGTKRGSHEIRC